MDNNVNFPAWTVPELADSQKEELLRKIPERFSIKRRNRRIVSGVIGLFSIMVISLFIKGSPLKRDIAITRSMLEDEISRNNENVSIAINESNNIIFEREVYYESSL